MIYCGCKKCGGEADKCFGDMHPGVEFNEAPESSAPQGQAGLPGYSSLGVQAVSAIKWSCAHCGYKQYSDDTLSEPDNNVRTDRILCENCGEDNAVYLQEL